MHLSDTAAAPGRRRKPHLLILGGIAVASLLLALSIGSLHVPLPQLWAAIHGAGIEPYRSVVLELRLPRAVAAFTVGAMLSLAGALMQVLLRNPLADPYVLGISGGAATGALTTIAVGLSGAWVGGAAFGGALLSMLLVFGVAHGSGSWTPTRLLLTGVVVAAGWGALISFILVMSTSRDLPGMLFWLMGDLSGARQWLPQLVLLSVALALCLPRARDFNLLARGELQAAALGVPVNGLRTMIYIIASLLTAGAVTIAGSIGFVGLVVPHMIRLTLGTDHRLLLPAATLAGGSLLVLADTLARSAFAPTQLPVGVLTALLGVPLFLYLLRRNR